MTNLYTNFLNFIVLQKVIDKTADSSLKLRVNTASCLEVV